MKGIICNIFFVLFLFCGLSNCSKDDTSELSLYHGILINMSTFDGCGWIIELDNKNKIEPRNLNDFNLTLQDSAGVLVRYQIPNDRSSYCMIGDVVEIVSIELE
jgi:hypothetical protein